MSIPHDLDPGRELDALTSVISHDLRAPLRAIDGFSRILLDKERTGALPEETRRFLELVRDAGSELADLLDGVVEIARATRAPVDRRPLDLARIAQETVAAVLQQRVPAGRSVEWVVADDLPAPVADQLLVRKLLIELLDNGLKFGGTRVALGWDTDAGAYVVADDGRGWKADADADGALPPRALEVFGRLVGREVPGTGAGLALAVRICARHGARLWGRAAPGGGDTRVWFTLARPEDGAPS